MKYFIIAGEASGDLHAAELIRHLHANDPGAAFMFFGGDKMSAAAGTGPIVHISAMAYMGFSEVLRHLGDIRRNIDIAAAVLRRWKPDAMIAVDYPSFNLRVAAMAAKAHIPVYYYIPPKIWAWKQWRIRQIKRLVRRAFCILPFEPAFYARHGYTADYVGNPTVGEIRHDLSQAGSDGAFRRRHTLDGRPVIALLPGSRHGEIRNNLPVMLAAVGELSQYQPVIVAAPGIADGEYRSGGAAIPLLRTPAAAVLAHAHAALVTSGTATLECAVAGVPQVVCYRANGSKLSYNIMKAALSVKYVSLPNLIADSAVVPELLLHRCTPAAAAEALRPLLDTQSPQRRAQLQGYQRIMQILGNDDAPAITARAIVADLSDK